MTDRALRSHLGGEGGGADAVARVGEHGEGLLADAFRRAFVGSDDARDAEGLGAVGAVVLITVLHLAVARRRSAEIRTARDGAAVGDLVGAVELLVEGYERWGAEILHLLAQERRSSAIAESLGEGRRFHREWVARVFAAPRLARLPETGRRRELAKLVAATDLYTWKVLRRDMDLDAEEARAAITETAAAIVAAIA